MSEDVMKPQHTPRAETPAMSKIQQQRNRRNNLAKATQVIWLITSGLEILLGIRVLLRLLGANPEAGFARFIYGMTSVFLAPFANLLPEPAANGFVLEISSLMGMLVYALLAWGIVRVMWVIFEHPPEDSSGPGGVA